MPEPISIYSAFAGKRVLLTGATGFVGKVWLAMLLDRLPDVARVYVLARPKALLSARERFEKVLNQSPVFAPMHERLGAGFGSLVASKLEVVEGEISEPGLGLSPDVHARLLREVDLVVHCAGLVDFNPDLRKALGTNVDGSLRVADFCEAGHAALLHISTCYVAGRRQGRIPEDVVSDVTPLGAPFDAAREYVDALRAAEAIVVEHESRERTAELIAQTDGQAGERKAGDRSRLAVNLAKRRMREELKSALQDEGMRRANALGWPNTYTYSKSMAEALLGARKGLRMAILRPSIVESSVEFPFAGWNESFNGSAPLAYVMGSWFRMVPAKPDAPFDVVPVDMVAKAMFVAGAALLENRHSPVYHTGTSDLHRCSVGRAAELIVLAHRKHFRQLGDRTERVFKSRFDSVLVEPDHWFSVQRNRGLLDIGREVLDLLPDKVQRRTQGLSRRLESSDKKLAQIEEMVRLYLPFMYESFHVFECRALGRTPAIERDFRFEPQALDWRSYWIDVHVPGLRRWAFPLIEGKRPERHRPSNPVRLAAMPLADAVHAETAATKMRPSRARRAPSVRPVAES
jgi:long-chain acyl-CoA synthetase